MTLLLMARNALNQCQDKLALIYALFRCHLNAWSSVEYNLVRRQSNYQDVHHLALKT